MFIFIIVLSLLILMVIVIQCVITERIPTEMDPFVLSKVLCQTTLLSSPPPEHGQTNLCSPSPPETVCSELLPWLKDVLLDFAVVAGLSGRAGRRQLNSWTAAPAGRGAAGPGLLPAGSPPPSYSLLGPPVTVAATGEKAGAGRWPSFRGRLVVALLCP